jgi:dipeptidyl-peptidase-4
MGRELICGPFIAIAAIVVASGAVRAQPNQAEKIFNDRFTTYKLQGYFVHVDADTWALGQKTVDSALETLDERLADTLALIPKDCRKRLEMIRFWVQGRSNGVLSIAGQEVLAPAAYCPIYHKLVGTGHEQEGGIVIGAQLVLVGEAKARANKQAPHLLLHELAHAYHDRVLEFDNLMVMSVFDSALRKRLYDNVETEIVDADGTIRTRNAEAYAKTNHLEYFAELSVAYLARNSTYPFTAEDLRKHDPDGYKLMESVWGEKPKHK